MKYRKHLDNVERISATHFSDKMIKLNSAERDVPLDDYIWGKYLENLKETDIRYYPDVEIARNLVSRFEGVKSSQVTLGAGSDQVIRNIFDCFVEPGQNVITTDPCFPMYHVYGKIYNVEVKQVPYYNRQKDVQRIVKNITSKTAVVMISNPNSPIGDSYNRDELQVIITAAQKVNAFVVVDEAYIQFAEDTVSLSDVAWSYSNLIVIKTFSKAIGAAGIRFGYGISNCKIAAMLSKVKSMYEITGPTIKWVQTVIENYAMVESYIDNVKSHRKILRNHLRKNYQVLESQCNWIHTTRTDYPGDIITRKCSLPWSKSIWVRLCIPGSVETLNKIIK